MTKKNHTLKTVLLYIVLALIAVIAIFPLFYIVMASFRTNIEIFDYALPFTWKTLIPQEWTFDNYVAIFEEFHFGLAFRCPYASPLWAGLYLRSSISKGRTFCSLCA